MPSLVTSLAQRCTGVSQPPMVLDLSTIPFRAGAVFRRQVFLKIQRTLVQADPLNGLQTLQQNVCVIEQRLSLEEWPKRKQDRTSRYAQNMIQKQRIEIEIREMTQKGQSKKQHGGSGAGKVLSAVSCVECHPAMSDTEDSRCTKSQEQVLKTLSQAAKKARTFESQKIIRKLKKLK